MDLSNFNPYSRAVRKHLFEMLGSKYTVEQDEMMERVMHAIGTKRDAESLGQLIGLIYQAGYTKALESAQKAIEGRGMKLSIKPPK